MKLVEVHDDGGDVMTCTEHNGFILPYFYNSRSLERLHSVTIRDDDVLICTYPKSGTHWVFEITREILTGELTMDDVTMASTFMDKTEEETYASIPSPRILSSHVCMEQLPADVLKKKIKIIFVLRNPKDVAVSYYSFLQSVSNYKGKWENYVRSLFQGKLAYGSWFDYVRNWEEVKKMHPEVPIHTMFYEDLQEDPMREMRNLCQFLGVEKSDEFLSQVARNTTFESMKAIKDAQVVLRKGKVGDWKNWFTVSQNVWFDQLYQEKMKDCDIKTRYTMDN